MAFQELKFYKVTALPAVLGSSCVYFLKKDASAELVIYMTNSAGTISYKTKDQADVITLVNSIIAQNPYLMPRNPNPVYTYGTGGNNKNPVRIDYSNGVYKTLEYNTNNSIKKISYFGPYFTIVKTYVYNTNGTVNRITELVS
jgi:hypothetical protein